VDLLDFVLLLVAIGVAIWAWGRLQGEVGTFFGILAVAVVLAVLFIPTDCASLDQLSREELLTLANPNSGVTCIVKDHQVGQRALVVVAVTFGTTWLWTRHLER
jgi:hypothetical protein